MSFTPAPHIRKWGNQPADQQTPVRLKSIYARWHIEPRRFLSPHKREDKIYPAAGWKVFSEKEEGKKNSMAWGGSDHVATMEKIPKGKKKKKMGRGLAAGLDNEAFAVIIIKGGRAAAELSHSSGGGQRRVKWRHRHGAKFPTNPFIKKKEKEKKRRPLARTPSIGSRDLSCTTLHCLLP